MAALGPPMPCSGSSAPRRRMAGSGCSPTNRGWWLSTCMGAASRCWARSTPGRPGSSAVLRRRRRSGLRWTGWVAIENHMGLRLAPPWPRRRRRSKKKKDKTPRTPTPVGAVGGGVEQSVQATAGTARPRAHAGAGSPSTMSPGAAGRCTRCSSRGGPRWRTSRDSKKIDALTTHAAALKGSSTRRLSRSSASRSSQEPLDREEAGRPRTRKPAAKGASEPHPQTSSLPVHRVAGLRPASKSGSGSSPQGPGPWGPAEPEEEWGPEWPIPSWTRPGGVQRTVRGIFTNSPAREPEMGPALRDADVPQRLGTGQLGRHQ